MNSQQAGSLRNVPAYIGQDPVYVFPFYSRQAGDRIRASNLRCRGHFLRYQGAADLLNRGWFCQIVDGSKPQGRKRCCNAAEAGQDNRANL